MNNDSSENIIPEMPPMQEHSNQKLSGQIEKSNKLNYEISSDYAAFPHKPGFFFAKLYIDSGNGYNEDNSIILEISGDENKLFFDLREYSTINGLNFVPLNDLAVIRINYIKGRLASTGNSIYFEYNGDADLNQDGSMIFEKQDQKIHVDLSENKKINQLIIDLEYLSLGLEVYKYLMEREKDIIEQNENKILLMNAELDKRINESEFIKTIVLEKESEIEKLQSELSNIELTVQLNLDKLNYSQAYLEEKDSLIQHLQGEISSIKNTITEKDHLISELDNSLNEKDIAIEKIHEELLGNEVLINIKEEELSSLNAKLIESEWVMNEKNNVLLIVVPYWIKEKDWTNLIKNEYEKAIYYYKHTESIPICLKQSNVNKLMAGFAQNPRVREQ